MESRTTLNRGSTSIREFVPKPSNSSSCSFAENCNLENSLNARFSGEDDCLLRFGGRRRGYGDLEWHGKEERRPDKGSESELSQAQERVERGERF